MIKHFCDRCGKQVIYKNLVSIYINDPNLIKCPKEICKSCYEKLEKFIIGFEKEVRK